MYNVEIKRCFTSDDILLKTNYMLKLMEKVHERFIKFITDMLFYNWEVECMAL